MSREYWDSCLFIAFLQDKPEERDLVNCIYTLLKRAEDPATGVMIVVSTLVLAEVRLKPAYQQEHWAIIQDLFYKNRPYIKVTGLRPRIADTAATIGEQHGLFVQDAVHIATALQEKVDVLLTIDGKRETHTRRRDLLPHDGLIGTPPLSIKPPSIPPNTQLLMPYRKE